MLRKSFLAGLSGLFFSSDVSAEPMNINISIPGDGSALKGVVPVTVEANPLKNLQRVSLTVDGNLLASDSTNPFTFSWDTTTVADGPHELVAQAFYKNRVSTGSLQVRVANVVVQPPPDPDPDPPPPTGYPASYFTGPLGAKNLLPASPDEALLMVWGPGEYGQATSWTQQKENILEREAAMGRKYNAIMNADDSEGRQAWVRDHGAIPITHFGSGFSMSQIASGGADAHLTTRAQYWASLGVPMIVRAFHEFNLPHTTYSLANAGSASTWIAAWRRMVEVVHRTAPNVGFWWCPTEGDDRAGTDSCYPGDDYVDWVGTDTYNWVMVGQDAWATPLHPGWAEFWECFDYGGAWTAGNSRLDQYGPRKPFMIGETGTKYDPNAPTKKPGWYRAIPSAIRNAGHLYGVCFFDQDVSPSEPGNNWLVQHPTSNPDCLNGFLDMARDSVWA